MRCQHQRVPSFDQSGRDFSDKTMGESQRPHLQIRVEHLVAPFTRNLSNFRSALSDSPGDGVISSRKIAL